MQEIKRELVCHKQQFCYDVDALAVTHHQCCCCYTCTCCRPAESRPAVKEVLVEMTKTARAAVTGSGSS